MSELPGTAAWRHLGAREGFEVVFPLPHAGGFRFEGDATAVEEGVAWSVRYTLVVDEGWASRSARVLTNAFPVHRLALEVGEHSEAPAVYVRAPDLRVERLEQRYLRLPDADGKARFDYESPAFDYRAVLVYDEGGLVLDYPGIAARLA